MSRSIRHDDERTDNPLVVRPNQQPLNEERREAKTPSSSNRTLIVGAVVVVALGIAALLWSRGTPPSTSQPISQPVAIVVTAVPTAASTATPERPTSVLPTATPNEPSITAYINIILAQEQVSRWGEAATTAEGALALPDLRDSDRKVLTQHAV